MCGGLIENGPYRLICSNAWSPVGGTIWVELRGVALLEEVCYWRWALRIQSMLFPIGTPSPPLCLYNYFQSENIFITLLFLNDLKNLMMT